MKTAVDMEEFYRRTKALRLDYRRLLLDMGENCFAMVNTFGDHGLSLLYLNGEEGGRIDVEGMKYWAAISVRRKIPKGTYRTLSVVLGIR